MSSRISRVFSDLRKKGKLGLVTYVTAGDPSLSRSADILKTLDQAGADVLEVGVPFSDPLADGPVIQRASERALASGTTLTQTLELIKRVRAVVQAPIVVFSYANPILRIGLESFAANASEAGVDGVLVLDLPIEEAGTFRHTLVEAGIDPIFLLSPTTTDLRIRQAAELGRGFLYGISRLGVTGARSEMATGVRGMVRRIRSVTSLPIAVGFGLSHPKHLQEIGKCADAAVVGSALVELIAQQADSEDLTTVIEDFIAWLKGGKGEGMDGS